MSSKNTIPASTPPDSFSADSEALKRLRKRQPAHRLIRHEGLTFGERIADGVAAVMGSWTFIILQSLILLCWITLNIYGWMKAWDPYPFILLNLMLSFQAAYAAPILMMAQNRQSDIDRKKAEKDYEVNLKAELEIEALHQKIDQLRDNDMKRLSDMIEKLLQKDRA